MICIYCVKEMIDDGGIDEFVAGIHDGSRIGKGRC